MLKSLYSTLFRDEGDPEWMDSLRGEDPLLGDSELKFISRVRSAIKQGPALDDECTPLATRSRNYDIQDFTRNFTELIEHLRMNSYESLFLQTYPQWRLHRADTIVKLKKIANSIDEDKRNCEIATAIGSGVSLIGALVCLFSDQKAQNTSMMTGSAMMGLGGLTTTGTSVIGSMLLRENISEAKEAIAKDRERMANLWKWMENTEHLLDTMNNIKSIDIGGSLQATARSLHSVSKMKLSSRGAQTKVKEVLSSFRCPQEMRGDISDVMGILVSVQMLCDRFRPLIQCARTGSDISSRLRLSAQLFSSAVGLSNALGASQAVCLTSRQRTLIIGGMCTDVASIVHAYMVRDSESVESRKIRRAIEILRDEGDLFRNLYDEIRGVNYVELRRVV